MHKYKVTKGNQCFIVKETELSKFDETYTTEQIEDEFYFSEDAEIQKNIGKILKDEFILDCSTNNIFLTSNIISFINHLEYGLFNQALIILNDCELSNEIKNKYINSITQNTL